MARLFRLPYRLWAAIGGLALIGALAAPASATLVLHMDLPALTEASQAVVVAEVLEVSSSWNEAHTRIRTRVRVRVAESWKGRLQGHDIEIVQPGGTAGEIEMRVHGMPRFEVGQRAVLFLRGPQDGQRGRFGVVGLSQGKRDLFRDVESQRWMARAPADEGAVVMRQPDGRLRAAPGHPVLTLDSLRTRVRALVEKAARTPSGGTKQP